MFVLHDGCSKANLYMRLVCVTITSHISFSVYDAIWGNKDGVAEKMFEVEGGIALGWK